MEVCLWAVSAATWFSHADLDGDFEPLAQFEPLAEREWYEGIVVTRDDDV